MRAANLYCFLKALWALEIIWQLLCCSSCPNYEYSQCALTGSLTPLLKDSFADAYSLCLNELICKQWWIVHWKFALALVTRLLFCGQSFPQWLTVHPTIHWTGISRGLRGSSCSSLESPNRQIMSRKDKEEYNMRYPWHLSFLIKYSSLSETQSENRHKSLLLPFFFQ